MRILFLLSMLISYESLGAAVTSETITPLTGLNEVTSLQATDLFYIVINVGTTNVASKKIRQGNLATNNMPTVSPGANTSVTTNLVAGQLVYTVNGNSGSGTNTLFQTNGVNIGAAGTINFTTGATGYLAGAVANIGISASGGGAGTFTTIKTNGATVSSSASSLNLINGSGLLLRSTNTAGAVDYQDLIDWTQAASQTNLTTVSNVGISGFQSGSNLSFTLAQNGTNNTNPRQGGSVNLTNWSGIVTDAVVRSLSGVATNLHINRNLIFDDNGLGAYYLTNGGDGSLSISNTLLGQIVWRADGGTAVIYEQLHGLGTGSNEGNFLVGQKVSATNVISSLFTGNGAGLTNVNSLASASNSGPFTLYSLTPGSAPTSILLNETSAVHYAGIQAPRIIQTNNVTSLPSNGLAGVWVTKANGSGTNDVVPVGLPSDATKYLDGTGAFSIPAGSSGQTNALIQVNGVTTALVSSLNFADGSGTTATVTSNSGLATVKFNVTGVSSSVAQTNFVLNTVYTNNNTTAIQICGLAQLTLGTVNGSASLDLMVAPSNSSTFTRISGASDGTTTLGFADVVTNSFCAPITNGCSYYLTNSSSGGGANAAALVPGTGFITVLGGGVAGAAGTSGTNGLNGTGSDISQYVQTYTAFDDFWYTGLSASTTSPGGQFGWISKVSSGTHAPLQGDTNAPGIFRFQTGTSAGFYAGIGNFTSGAGNDPYYIRGVWTNEWRFRIGQTNVASGAGASGIMLGYHDTAGAAAANGAYLQYDTNNLAWVYVYSVAGGGTKTTNTTPTLLPVPMQWYKFRTVFTQNGTTTNCVFTIDGAQSATITSTTLLPTFTALGCNIKNLNTTTNCNLDIDYVYLGYSLEFTR